MSDLKSRTISRILTSNFEKVLYLKVQLDLHGHIKLSGLRKGKRSSFMKYVLKFDLMTSNRIERTVRERNVDLRGYNY